MNYNEHHSELRQLCAKLAAQAGELRSTDNWPTEQLAWCGQANVYRWFTPEPWGGWDWDEPSILRGYIELSAACLTTTFIITQRSAACRRLVLSDNRDLQEQWLRRLSDGSAMTTVGISQLTTSHRHLGRAALQATEASDGWVLNGFSPWVTGARAADLLVVGAATDDGNQLLLAVEPNWPGVQVQPGQSLIALSASGTGRVDFRQVHVPASHRIAGPHPNVLQTTSTATGGLHTSALALGLARAAIEYLMNQSKDRRDLLAVADALRQRWDAAVVVALDLAAGRTSGSPDHVRTEANDLVLTATQSALAAAKGAGFAAGHPVGRWCCEALFFLVWSCPQHVLDAHLCEWAGLES